MEGQTKTTEQLQNEIRRLRRENETLLAKLNVHEKLSCQNPKTLPHKKGDDFKPNPVFSQLTKREKQVLELISKSHTSKEIAAILNISKLTVDTHRKHILKKLEVSSLIDLLKLVISHKNS